VRDFVRCAVLNVQGIVGVSPHTRIRATDRKDMTPKSLLAPARLAGRPVLRSQSDERLVDLARSGSEPAFEAIVARYRAPLTRYCRRILPEARAEDAVQQAFVSAFAALRRNDAHIDLRPWLYRITHNTALNALRDRGLRHSELDERIDGVERPDQVLERRQGLRDVIAAIKALPNRQRDAMILRELEGRSYEEIAVELGVTGGAVRQLLNRARTTLRAGVTAVTPLPLMARLWSGEGEPAAARVGELLGAGGAGALATKVAATAIVTGVVAGGIAGGPARHHGADGVADPPAATAASDARHAVSGGGSDSGAGGRPTAGSAETGDPGGQGERRDGESGGDGRTGGDDPSGSGSTEGHGDDGGHSGPGGGGGDHFEPGGSGSSGPGPGGGGGSGHEGPGASGSGSEGPGPGGSGSDGGVDGSSGSGSSGSGSSGSGTDDALSTSGSSGSSGSDHGSDDTTTNDSSGRR
jgi:RNA polymerase sigma factor (sigma-70 family)